MDCLVKDDFEIMIPLKFFSCDPENSLKINKYPNAMGPMLATQALVDRQRFSFSVSLVELFIYYKVYNSRRELR